LAGYGPEREMSVERVQLLEKLYEKGQGSGLLDLTLDKLFAYELHNTRQQLEELEQDLAEFEERYALSSREFYERYQAGEMGDEMDYVEWASLHQMTERLRERIELLESTA
jgi:hypothetical protein